MPDRVRDMSILEAFLDGVTAAGLYRPLRWPGAPTEFIDSRPVIHPDDVADARLLRARVLLEQLRDALAENAETEQRKRALEAFRALSAILAEQNLSAEFKPGKAIETRC